MNNIVLFEPEIPQNTGNIMRTCVATDTKLHLIKPLGFVIDDAKKQKLKDVFWDMHTITKRTETLTSGETSEIVLYITITAKTKDEMISEYGFTRKQKEALETLLENADGFIGTTQSLAISDATAQDVIDNLPDSLSAERKNVVK